MSFCSSASGRACVNDWDRPLSVQDILEFLLALQRAAVTAGGSVVLIMVIRESMPIPANFLLTCIQGTLPAILDCCEQFLLVVEGTETARNRLHSAFQAPRQSITRRPQVQFSDTLSAAFGQAQRLAPHDVLELQRRMLHHSSPPNGRST